MTPAHAGHGILFDSSLLHSPLLVVLDAFVLVNTVMFLALALLNLSPKIYVSDWLTSRNRRAETRSIYPDPPESGEAATEPPLEAAAGVSRRTAA